MSLRAAHESVSVDALPSGLVGRDADGIVRLWNEGAERITGRAEADAIGTLVRAALGLDDERRHADVEEFRAHYENEPVRVSELYVRRADGSTIPVIATTSLWFDVDPGPGVLMTISDATNLHDVVDPADPLHDQLTGLPTRALFLDRAARAMRWCDRLGAPLSMLVIGVDHLSRVEEGLGAEGGDAVMAAVAGMLATTVPRGATLARTYGDAFALLLPEHDSFQAVRIAHDVVDQLHTSLEVAGQRIPVTVSVGVSHGARGTTDEGAIALLQDARTAYLAARAEGGNRWLVFASAVRRRAAERLTVEFELRRAIDGDELRILYQPIVGLGSGDVVGVEALVAWEHPTRGLLRAGDFVPFAEQIGLIGGIDSWVVHHACAQHADLLARRPPGDPLTLSVNISPSDVQADGFVAMIHDAVAGSGLPAELLTIELTESDLLEPTAVLDAVTDLGIGLAVDDFGIGYSSLRNLSRLPVNAVKVDQSFVAGLGVRSEDEGIVAGVLSIARTLGLHAVAEGVETPGQLAALRALGYDFAQGFLVAHAMPSDALGPWLDEYDREVVSGVGPTTARLASRVPRAPWASAEGAALGSALTSLTGDADSPELRTARALLRVEHAEEAVGVLIGLVQSLGGRTIPARLDHEWAFGPPIDLGDGEAMRVVAAPATTARQRIEAILPIVLEDARTALAAIGRRDGSGQHAATDPLTGLRSSFEFARRLHRAHVGDSIVVIDLDRLQQVNDEQGTQRGDDVLRSLSRRLREQARSVDICGRTDGDEFSVLMPRTSVAGATAVLARLRGVWRECRPAPVGFSSGIAAVSALGGDDAMGRARGALQVAKTSGRNRDSVARDGDAAQVC